ncbi:helix-turn-helix transcriptional regulator [Nonomuraea sp. NPDC047897]|uniref:helix-turn-helix transcriptional regulator n=1 Tax=Nonomuraea sp. NPDC047897 TaxID=3364346 RepID=UPI003723B1E3
MSKIADDRPRWTFLTNHARVLLEIARDPQVRVRDIAAVIGITERAAQGIVTDLREAGYLDPVRVGRRNHYTIDAAQHFRHPTEANMPVQVLIDMFTHRDTAGAPTGHRSLADTTTVRAPAVDERATDDRATNGPAAVSR